MATISKPTMSMPTTSKPTMSKPTMSKPIRMLSFDGGTPEGVVTQVSLVQEILSRISYDQDMDVDSAEMRPCEYFDIIAGSGLGGVLALMFGHRKMKCREARKELEELLEKVYVEPADERTNLQWVASAILGTSSSTGIVGEEKINHKGLKTAMKKIFDVPVEVAAGDKGSDCVAVVFVRSTFNLANCREAVFQNGNALKLGCSVTEAACATVSIPDLFPPTNFSNGDTFISAGLGSINPTRELIRVAENIYKGERRVACIVNIGSGSRGAVRHRVINGTKNGEETAVDDVTRSIEDHIAVDALRTAEDLKRRLTNTPYFYLSVDSGLHDSKMTGWSLSNAEAHADSYRSRAESDKLIDACVGDLLKDAGGVTLRQLVQSTATGVNAKSFSKPPHHFVEPIKEYNQIYEALIRQHHEVVVVTGRLGCGKTLLSSYFAYREQKRYKHIFLIDSNTEGDIRGDLQTAIRSLGPEHRHDSWEQALTYFRTTEDSWLIIFDGVGEYVGTTVNLPELIPYNKNKNGKIIINSRHTKFANLAPKAHIQMGPRSDRDAMKILEKTAHYDTLIGDAYTHAHRLCKAVGCSPVVLVQAGTYCRRLSSYEEGARQSFNFNSYKKMYEMGKQRWELLGEKAPSGMDGYNQYFMATLEADMERGKSSLR